MKDIEINIFYEDNDIIVCEKPAGVPSQSDKTSDYDMVNRLKNYLQIKAPYIGLVHRLDRPVGGVMVFAKTPKALKNLNEQIRKGTISKRYIAVSDCDTDIVKDEWKKISNYIVKDAKTNTSRISKPNEKDAKRAELNYRLIGKNKYNNRINSVIEVELLTGRHHQIRVQMAAEGLPLWGDTKYNKEFMKNNPELKWAEVALYSYRLEFTHPITNKNMVFEYKPDKEIYICY